MSAKFVMVAGLSFVGVDVTITSFTCRVRSRSVRKVFSEVELNEDFGVDDSNNGDDVDSDVGNEVGNGV